MNKLVKPNMNLQQLKIVVLIAEYKQVTAVAEKLQLKQPTVTFHMKKLEQFAGVPLFEWKHKRVFLTDAGQALLHYAKRIVTLSEEAQQVLSDYRQFNRGKIIVGASNTAATYFLPPLLGKMQQAYPKIQIQFEVKNTPEIVEKIKKSEFDFGIAADHQIDDPDLIAIPLVEDELGLVLYPNHPLARADLIYPELLQKQPWILREKGSSTRRMCEMWAKDSHVELNESLELGATEAIKQAVIAQLGISILSRIAVAEEVAKEKLAFKKLLSPSLTRRIYLIYNRNRFITPMIRDFIDFFEKKSKEM